MTGIKKIKISWLAFGIIVIVYAVIGIINYDGNWTNSFLQVGAILLTMVFTIFLTIENNKQLARQTRDQIDFISENTDRQINESKKFTEEQIKAIKESTDKQIENYRRETEKLCQELKNNTELLAGILKRQLEEAIQETIDELDRAKYKLNDLSGFKIFRSKEEKEKQLKKHKLLIERVENKLKYFKESYIKISKFS